MRHNANKLMSVSIVLTLLSIACGAQTTWMLQKDNGCWIQFTSEAEWRKTVDQIQPLETAVIRKSSNSIRVVYDVQGKSGDWRNIDNYVFKVDGMLISLERQLASVSQNIKIAESFELDKAGQVQQTNKHEVSLSTGQATDKRPEKQLPIATSMRQLSFIKDR